MKKVIMLCCLGAYMLWTAGEIVVLGKPGKSVHMIENTDLTPHLYNAISLTKVNADPLF